MKDMKGNDRNVRWYGNLIDEYKYYLKVFNQSDRGGF